MNRLATLHFHGGDLSFSAGHFTVFSETHREYLHGHHYRLDVSVTAPLDDLGLTFDYAIFDNKLAALCDQLDKHVLMPENCRYLSVKDEDPHYRITFNGQYMLLLKTDVILLPIQNITIEELSDWFIRQIEKDQDFLKQYQIRDISVRIFNGLDHSATAVWQALEKP